MKQLTLLCSFLLLLTNLSPAVAAEAKLSKEEKSEARFFKKFDKHFNDFADEMYVDMDYYSDEELNQIYLDMITWLDQHGNYQEADAMMSIHGKFSGNVRKQLRYMISEQAHQESIAYLKAEIAKAGGFSAYQSQMKAMKKENLDVACRVEKIAAAAVILPLSGFGALTAISAASALYYGIFTPVVGAWIITTVGIHGYVSPFLINHIVVGCYNERDTVNTKKLFIKNGKFKASCTNTKGNFETEISITDTAKGTTATLSMGTLVEETILLKPRMFKNQYKNAKKDKNNNSRILLQTENRENSIFEFPTSLNFQNKSIPEGVSCKMI